MNIEIKRIKINKLGHFVLLYTSTMYDSRIITIGKYVSWQSVALLSHCHFFNGSLAFWKLKSARSNYYLYHNTCSNKIVVCKDFKVWRMYHEDIEDFPKRLDFLRDSGRFPFTENNCVSWNSSVGTYSFTKLVTGIVHIPNHLTPLEILPLVPLVPYHPVK